MKTSSTRLNQWVHSYKGQLNKWLFPDVFVAGPSLAIVEYLGGTPKAVIRQGNHTVGGWSGVDELRYVEMLPRKVTITERPLARTLDDVEVEVDFSLQVKPGENETAITAISYDAQSALDSLIAAVIGKIRDYCSTTNFSGLKTGIADLQIKIDEINACFTVFQFAGLTFTPLNEEIRLSMDVLAVEKSKAFIAAATAENKRKIEESERDKRQRELKEKQDTDKSNSKIKREIEAEQYAQDLAFKKDLVDMIGNDFNKHAILSPETAAVVLSKHKEELAYNKKAIEAEATAKAQAKVIEVFQSIIPAMHANQEQKIKHVYEMPQNKIGRSKPRKKSKPKE